MNDLQETISVVTGAAAGLGEACAQELARRGSRVVLVDRSAAALEAVRRGLPGPLEHLATVCDVSNSDEVFAAVAHIERVAGPVDILVNCAGMNAAERHFDVLQADTWDRVIAVNLAGTYYWCQAVLGSMRRRRSGTIINVSSWAGRHATYFAGAAYSASKRAVLALTESLNLEEGMHNIRATAIVPEAMATAMIRQSPVRPSDAELDRMLRPEDVARLAGLIASLPPHVCVNELVVSPTWNRSYLGGYETALSRKEPGTPAS